MNTVGRTIHIDAEPDRVFALIDDPSRYPEFFSGITRWEPRSEQRTGVGARYRVLMRVGSIEAGGTIRVDEHEPGRCIAWVAEKGVRQEGRWLVTRARGGSDLALEVGFDLSGGPVGALVERLAGRIVARNIWATLLTARRILEL